MLKCDIRYYLSINKDINKLLIDEANIEMCSPSFIAKNIIYEKYGYFLLKDYRDAITKIKNMEIGYKFQIKDIIDSNSQMYKVIFGIEISENMDLLNIKVSSKKAGVNVFEKL